MMTGLIILSKCQDLCLFWVYVPDVFSAGSHVVDIDFQPLGLKSDHKEGVIMGTEF
jgi:hypothetical protein